MTPDQPLQTIVVGVDGSVAAMAALPWAARRVSKSGTIHVVHALARGQEPDPRWPTLAGPWMDLMHRSPPHVEWAAVAGEPADVLRAEVQKRGAGLLVVGAHGVGESGRRSPFLGGVTRSLLSRTEVPLVVHHGSNERSDGPVVAAIGYGDPTEAAVNFAATYAHSIERPMVLLHAVSRRPLYPIDSPVDMLGSYLGPGVDHEWAAADLAARREEILERFPDLDISTRTVPGSAVHAILHVAAGSGSGQPAEIVAVGHPSSRHLPPSPRLYQVVARAKWPTVIVPSCPPKD